MSSTTYYDEGCAQYAAAGWVQEIATKVAATMHAMRPFTRDDIIVDYGCGPGITLEKIFYLNHSLQTEKTGDEAAEAAQCEQRQRIDPALIPSSAEGALLGRHARICDISQQSIFMSRQLATVRCPLKGVWADFISAFESADSDRLSATFLSWLPRHIDCAYSSLVAEYLTFPQIAALSRVLLERLEDGGLLAWFDWCEHPAYAAEHSAGVHQPTGVKKADWARLAALLVEHVEQAELRLQQRMEAAGGAEGRSPFLPLPDWRLQLQLGTFEVSAAAEQRVPSGDCVHYLLVKKSMTSSNTTFKKLVVPR